jgi:hypothetical protein
MNEDNAIVGSAFKGPLCCECRVVADIVRKYRSSLLDGKLLLPLIGMSIS